MSALPQETIQFEAPGDVKRLLEDGAARLNITVGAYVRYLLLRESDGKDPAQFDRMVHEVFGRYGEVMRRLAK